MTKTAKLYGDSLYELALEKQEKADQGYCDRMEEQLQAVCGIFRDNPDYIRLLQEPSVPRRERIGLIDQAFGGQVEEYLLNFLKLLCESELLQEFRGCCEQFKLRYQKDHGIAEAYVTSAVALSAAQQGALEKKLEDVYQKKILLMIKVDPSQMGGMKVEIEGKQLDGTVRGRLERLHRQIQK